MDYREGNPKILSRVNPAMGGAKEEAVNEVEKTVPSSPKLECYACGKEFESEEELDLHVRRCDTWQ